MAFEMLSMETGPTLMIGDPNLGDGHLSRENMETEEEKQISNICSEKTPLIQPLIHIRDADFKWLKTSPCTSLSNVNISIEAGKFICIVGPVGSGKSTLLSTMLNELYMSKGGYI